MTQTHPFLIGKNMRGGYGKGADILNDCTISVGYRADCRDSRSERRGQIHRYEGDVWAC